MQTKTKKEKIERRKILTYSFEKTEKNGVKMNDGMVGRGDV